MKSLLKQGTKTKQKKEKNRTPMSKHKHTIKEIS